MRKVVNFLISKIKHEPYQIDEHLRLAVLFHESLNRMFQLLWGVIRFRTHAKFPAFISKRIQVRDMANIHLGKGVTVEKDVVLDAASVNGLVVGDNVKIGRYTQIRCSGTLKQLGKGFIIGENSGIGEFSFFGAAGGISIGSNAIMGQNVRMHAENHNYADSKVPIRLQGVTHSGIVVKDNCWLGAGVVVLDGVTIGSGCVIGANSLVTKDIPDNSVAVGSPAKVIKSRLE